jgi:hypothetical protein
MPYRPGTNTGHGHVWPRPDGVRARCGGPAICKDCAFDEGSKRMTANIDASGIPVPTPAQINDRANDVGAVYILISRRGMYREMSVMNPDLVRDDPKALEAVLSQITANLAMVVEAGAKKA